jgi:hypothetical protein
MTRSEDGRYPHAPGDPASVADHDQVQAEMLDAVRSAQAAMVTWVDADGQGHTRAYVHGPVLLERFLFSQTAQSATRLLDEVPDGD